MVAGGRGRSKRQRQAPAIFPLHGRPHAHRLRDSPPGNPVREALDARKEPKTVAVRIRLKRLGRRNRPFWRLCATDRRTARDGRVIEELGHYDPHLDNENKVKVRRDRIVHWLKQGARPSKTVRELLGHLGLDAGGNEIPPKPWPRKTSQAPPPKAAERLAAAKPEAESAEKAEAAAETPGAGEEKAETNEQTPEAPGTETESAPAAGTDQPAGGEADPDSDDPAGAAGGPDASA